MNLRSDDMDRMSRRILAAMIVAGGLLTILSFTIHLDQGRLRSNFDSIIGRATSAIGGAEVQLR